MSREPLERAEQKAREIGQLLKKAVPLDSGWCFFLILASIDGRESKSQFPCMTYLASAERECSIKLLREMADKLENKTEEI